MRAEWTITPAQFKQWRRQTLLLRLVVVPLASAVCVGMAFLPKLLPGTRAQPDPPLGMTFWLALSALVLYVLIFYVPPLWNSYVLLIRRHQLLLASKGNFCPWCCAPVTSTPCRHGLSEEHSALLCEFWEGSILNWKGRAGAAFQSVSLIVARSPNASWSARLRETLRATLMDPHAAWTRRFAAAIMSTALPMMLWLFVFPQLAGMEFMAKSSFLPISIGGAVMMAALMASMAPAIAAARSAPLRCAACGYELPPQRSQPVCAECGHSLTAPGSVVQPGMKMAWKPFIIISLLISPLLLWPAISSFGLHYRWMNSAQLVASVQGAEPRQQWLLTQQLEGRSLSPAELHALSDALVASSSLQDDVSYFQSSSVLGKALLSGALATSDAQNIIQATTQVQIEPPATIALGKPFALAVKATFGSNHFQMTHMRCILCSRLTVDGVDIPLQPCMFTRSQSGQPTTIPVPAFTTPGRHTITLHAWSMAVPFASFKQNIPLDSSGVPVLPPGSACAELTADATINVTQAELSQPAQPAQPAQPVRPTPPPAP